MQTWKVDKPYLDLDCDLGEGPAYDPKIQALHFFDYGKHKWHIIDLKVGPESLETYPLPEIVTKSAFVEGNDSQLICSAKKGFVTLCRRVHQLQYVHEVWSPDEADDKNVSQRFNDGAVDPQGRFWAGTMREDKTDTKKGVVFRMDHDKKVHRMIQDVSIPNGAGWSLDGKTLYFVDSPTLNVYRYDFNGADGSISNRQVFFHLDDVEGSIPDGLAIDVEGNLWVAIHGGGKVIRVSAEGKKTGEVLLPTSLITCPVFAGTKLFITSAKEASAHGKVNEKGDQAGYLFMVDVGVEGAPVPKYRKTW